MPARVLIADDHPVFRAGLRALIAGAPELEVVEEAGTVEEVVHRSARCKPDVVVMDLRLPDGTGIEATRRVLAERPATAILMLSMHDDEMSVLEAMRVGARGYAIKGSDGEAVLGAVRAVARGEAIFGPAIADRMLRLFAQAPGPAARAFPELTERERDVLELLAGGAGTAKIAQRLSLTGKTVRNHLSSICNKLRVLDRGEAAERAREAGLGRSAPR